VWDSVVERGALLFGRTTYEVGKAWLRIIAQGSTLLGLLMIALLWIGLGIYSDSKRAATERAAVQNSDNLARAFEEHLSRSLRELDRSLKIMRARWVRNPDDTEFWNWLRGSELFDDQTVQIAVIDSQGLLRVSSVGGLTSNKLDLSDREHFKVHRDSTEDKLFISKPVVGRLSGRWSIQLTRRIENSDGSFGGVVVVSLDPAYLARFYNSVDVPNDGYIGVIGADGIIRAASGRGAVPIGTDVSQAALFQHYPAEPSGWFYSANSFIDGSPRLITYRALADYPLAVAIALSTPDIFAGAEDERRLYQLAATAVTLLILAVVGLSIRSRWLREKLAEDLNIQNARLNALLTNMPLGVCMFDNKARLAISNDRYLSMYGLSADATPAGTPLEEVVRSRKAVGSLSDDEGEFYDHLAERLKAGALVAGSLRLTDGRVVSVRNQPVEGSGWVSIHEDTTEQQLAKARLEQTRKFLDTIIENVPVAIVVKDAHTLEFVLVNQAYEGFIGRPREDVVGKTVFDLFDQADAERITRFDHEAVQANKRQVHGDFPVENRAKGTRIVNTTRLVVCDEYDKPQYLIVVIDDVTEKKKAEAKIAHMAHHDPITGLLNRARFNERLDAALAWVNRGEQLAVMLLDLDQFKQVNDTYGHLVGDELLKAVAERLRGCLRETDFVARFGGDEFAIIQTDIDGPADVSMLAERIRTAIMAPYDLGGIAANVGVSIGIARAPADATISAELLRQADVALYRAKSDGRGVYRFFEPGLDAAIAARREFEADLVNALERDEFELFYQPIVDIRTNAIVSLEALLRWHHPRRGTIAPGEFMAAAEQSGLIVPIGEWVLRRACLDAAQWPSGVKLALNVSPVQLGNERLVQVLMSALAASGLSATRLEFEITEEMLFEHNRDNLGVLQQLRALGAGIVMDDFGIGNASLNNLRSFQFDKIKIDCSLANELPSGSDLSLAIVQAVTRLARALGVPAIAEGIETKEQLDLVRAAGCSEFQGFVFCPPRPANEIMRLFDTGGQAARGAA
jgi:diguanylate cyclase (GGDEF)-like protein/PAS domain S-box-containing protein